MIVTLLTDFGTTDSYVAETKAAILSLAPATTLVDVTHDLRQGDVRSARYLLARTWPHFPAGTVHLTVVDPGVGTARRALAATSQGHSFVAPDNGLLTPILDSATVVQLSVPPDASATFHGRDVFAPAAARLARGDDIAQLGSPVGDPIRERDPEPRVEGDRVVGHVVYIDRFGTLVSNIPSASADAARGVTVAGGYTAPLARTFGDVALGDLVAFRGSAGTVEIAARNRSAAQLTGAGIGAQIQLEGTPSR